jgi:hypothetical protein
MHAIDYDLSDEARAKLRAALDPEVPDVRSFATDSGLFGRSRAR